jgi:hypothetical protein
MPSGVIVYSNNNEWDANTNGYAHRISFLVNGINRADELIMGAPSNPNQVAWTFPNGTLNTGDQVDIFVASPYAESNPDSTPTLSIDIGSTGYGVTVGTLCGDIHYVQKTITV